MARAPGAGLPGEGDRPTSPAEARRLQERLRDRIVDLGEVDGATARRRTDFPYVPGLLSFREAPASLDALERLGTEIDLLLVDGHGVAHPRRFGLACHLGVLADLPSIGVAKSRLVGRHEEPAEERGSREALVDGDEVVGAVVRTRAGVRPVFVSVGHRVGLETAVELVLRCAPRYRLPEPIRQADRLSRRVAGIHLRRGAPTRDGRLTP